MALLVALAPEFAPGSVDFCAGQFTGERINSRMQITTGDTVLQPNQWHTVESVLLPSRQVAEPFEGAGRVRVGDL